MTTVLLVAVGSVGAEIKIRRKSKFCMTASFLLQKKKMLLNSMYEIETLVKEIMLQGEA